MRAALRFSPLGIGMSSLVIMFMGVVLLSLMNGWK